MLAPGEVRRVVVLRALGLGDLLTALPAVRAVRRAHPRAHLTLAAPAWLRPVAELSGAVDELVDAAPLAPLDPVLREPDLAVNLHGRGPESTAVLRATAPARLVAYGESSTWRDDEHEVVRWCRLVAEAGMAAHPGELDLPVPPESPLARDAVLVHPGSAAASRRWPAARWAQVAGALPGTVLVTAGPGEQDLAGEVAARAGLPADAVVAGLDLRQLTGLVASSRLLLASDTGVAHLATAVRTPSVVLFGPVSPARWGPPADRAQHVALWGGVPSPDAAPSPAPALLAVSPAQVVEAAHRLLGQSGRPSRRLSRPR